MRTGNTDSEKLGGVSVGSNHSKLCQVAAPSSCKNPVLFGARRGHSQLWWGAWAGSSGEEQEVWLGYGMPDSCLHPWQLGGLDQSRPIGVMLVLIQGLGKVSHSM